MPSHADPLPDAPDSQDDNKAHRVSLCFKDNQAKFSGDGKECLDDYVAEYDLVGRAYRLSQDQKLRFFHNLLRGDAERFYLAEVEPTVKSYQEAVARIRAEYHSAVHQNQTQNVLESLRMATFVSEGMSEQDALAKTYKTVANTSKLLPASHMGDVHPVRYLKGAVVGYAWASEPLSQIPTSALGFQQLYGELQSALFMSNEAKRVVLQDSVTGVTPASGSYTALDVLYGGQRWYAKTPKGSGDRAASKAVARFNPLSLMGCFNCDKPDHAAKDCPAPFDVAKRDARRREYQLKRNAKRAAIADVLYELCGQLGDEAPSDGMVTVDVSDGAVTDKGKEPRVYVPGASARHRLAVGGR